MGTFNFGEALKVNEIVPHNLIPVHVHVFILDYLIGNIFFYIFSVVSFRSSLLFSFVCLHKTNNFNIILSFK